MYLLSNCRLPLLLTKLNDVHIAHTSSVPMDIISTQLSVSVSRVRLLLIDHAVLVVLHHAAIGSRSWIQKHAGVSARTARLTVTSCSYSIHALAPAYVSLWFQQTTMTIPIALMTLMIPRLMIALIPRALVPRALALVQGAPVQGAPVQGELVLGELVPGELVPGVEEVLDEEVLDVEKEVSLLHLVLLMKM